jgi:hypothetical protein
MPHQDVPNTVRVEVNYAYDNNNMANVFHVRTSDVPSDTDLNTIATNMQTWLDTEWKPLAPTAISAQSIICTSLHDLSGPRRAYAISPAIAGTNTSPALPANVTLAVRANIGTRGRGRSGRTFWIGLCEDQVTNNEVNSTTATAVISAMTALNEVMADIGANLEGLTSPHFVVGGVRPPVVATSDVLSYSLANFVTDSQRDRLPGHKKAKKRRPTPSPT